MVSMHDISIKEKVKEKNMKTILYVNLQKLVISAQQ